MSKTYRPWNPDQPWLLPPSPREWLPEGDLAYFVMDVAGQLDISAITDYYERSNRGFPPYHPRMMATLLVYSYCNGVFSSRRIQRRCERDAAYRVIVGSDVPDFRTISDFRKIHLKALSGLFLQVLGLCREAGLVKLGHVALDGTKVKANASRHKAMSYGRMKEEEERLKGEIDALLGRAQQTDEEEDREFGNKRGDELPKELARRESRLKKIQHAKAALEARAKAKAEEEKARKQPPQCPSGDAPCTPPQGPASVGSQGKPVVPDDKSQYNFTDPTSSIMKANNKGWDQCGNAQAVVDGQAQVIVAADVTNQANDKRQVQPMLAQAIDNIRKTQTDEDEDAKIGAALMDSGYFSEENIQWMAEHGIDGHVATERIKHHERVPDAPCGRPPADLTAKEKMARKLRTKKGRKTYAKRKTIVEPVFGQIKRCRGFVQFLLRGIDKMRGEWSLVCMTHNLLKLFGARIAAFG
jgi:transposase